jgi:hypothetical protein
VNHRETAKRLKNAITGHVNVATVSNLKTAITRHVNAATVSNLKTAITRHVNAATVSNLKTAVTGNVRRTALIGTAAVALGGAIAAPAMTRGQDNAGHSTTAAFAQDSSGVNKTSYVIETGGKSKPATKSGKPDAAPKAPTGKALSPRRITMHQSTIKIGKAQMANAKKIIVEGQRRHLPPRAWVIALSTSLQETKLHNYGRLKHNDHDSLGLFQQRPSTGWGKPKDLVNPSYAAGKFYAALMHVHNWKTLPVTVAAQSVQVSAFPTRYAQWEKLAANLVLATYGQGPYAHVAGAR